MKRIETEVSGGCQCGAVRFHASEMLDNSHLCHCRMCQKAAGNLFAALVAAPDEALQWTRGTPAVWRSSGHVERGFCADCGTPLFFHDSRTGRTNLMIGALDRPADFPPRNQIGTESRLPWFGALHELEEGGTIEAIDADWAAKIKTSTRQHPDHDTAAWPPAGED